MCRRKGEQGPAPTADEVGAKSGGLLIPLASVLLIAEEPGVQWQEGDETYKVTLDCGGSGSL